MKYVCRRPNRNLCRRTIVVHPQSLTVFSIFFNVLGDLGSIRQKAAVRRYSASGGRGVPSAQMRSGLQSFISGSVDGERDARGGARRHRPQGHQRSRGNMFF